MSTCTLENMELGNTKTTAGISTYCNINRLESIGLTFDIDWAPEFVISEMVELLKSYEVKATLFCTHSSNVIRDLTDDDNFEIALHPNFSNSSSHGKTEIDVMDYLLKLHPEAKGVRSHSLVQSTPVLELFIEKRMEYDCNLFMFAQSYLAPFINWNGLVRIPYYFEDDLYSSYGYPWEIENTDLKSQGLKIFDFHPIHIFLNSNNMNNYNSARKNSDPITETDEAELSKYKNLVERGTKDFLIDILDLIKNENIATYTLLELVHEVRKNEDTLFRNPKAGIFRA